MSLSRRQATAHAKASALIAQAGTLSLDDKLFVLENFHEAADSNNRVLGAHFTPLDLARDFTLEVCGPKVLDLCAGIGTLSFAYRHFWDHGDVAPEIVCVEANPRYVEVGRRILPEATWMCGDVFDPDLQERLKAEGCRTAIANPPYGTFARRSRPAPRYRGGLFEYALIDVASDLAAFGAFLIPQGSTPFRYSGAPCFQDLRDPEMSDPQSRMVMETYRPFHLATGIDLSHGVGVDTSIYRDQWRGVRPNVEIVTADFTVARAARAEAESRRTRQLALAV